MTKLAEFTSRNLAAAGSAAAQNRGTVWLDSSMSIGDRGHRSLLAHSPRVELVYDQCTMTLTRDGSAVDTPATLGTALTAVEGLVRENNWIAIGGISYDGMLEFLGLQSRHNTSFPALHFFLYDRVESLDHFKSTDFPTKSDEFTPSRALPQLVRGIDKKSYVGKVIEIKQRIFEGDIYQANLTHRFDLASSLKPFDVYRRLRALSPAPYSGYMNFGSFQILCSSPERMFLRKGDYVTTGPIKGTIRRGLDAQTDGQLTAELQRSTKDQAEHLMIVDLERNDLGKIARTGTVSVPALMRPELYSGLIHLVSDVTAQLQPGVTFGEICAALLPGGSITGAPKRAAVEILDGIEETPRGYYTGCLGYVSRERADFNIAIRTLIHQDGVYHFHAGGGIVADSDPEQEYQELLLKAHNLFRSLEVEQSSIEV